MLTRLGPSAVTAGEAEAAELFPSKLEFNPPAHGMWNIVHIGMLVPEAHQVYVCAVNCMRGVVLTAAEMGASDRFSCVILKEEDIIRGAVEEVTLRGIADVLRKLDRLPPCVIVFPVCTHHFLGVSMARVYRELEKEFPGVDFVRAFMDPVSRKRLPPDVRLRKVMYDPLRPCEPDEKLICLMGSDFTHGADSDLPGLLEAGGSRYTDICRCRSYDEYLKLSRAGTIVCVTPSGAYGAEQTALRLGRKYLYLPMSFSFSEIAAQEHTLCSSLGLPAPDPEAEIARCDKELAAAREEIGDVPVAIDAAAHPRPLGLARLLLEHGFRVEEIYLDAVSAEEADALAWLRKHAPDVTLSSVVLPEMRVAQRRREEKFLAVGQKAAWFTDTDRFVNIVLGGGLWGFAGVRAMARLMREAWREAKDTRDLIPRKGWGCESCY